MERATRGCATLSPRLEWGVVHAHRRCSHIREHMGEVRERHGWLYREHMGEEFTANDFRTWGGTLTAAIALAEHGVAWSDAEAKRW